ncbi:MAG: hypothetical protein AB8B99_19480 [Phormidesmis sp.]
MQSFREPAAPVRPAPSLSIPVPIDFALVAGTIPLLAFVVSARLVAEGLTELGNASEELFRGERLPTRPLMQQAANETEHS